MMSGQNDLVTFDHVTDSGQIVTQEPNQPPVIYDAHKFPKVYIRAGNKQRVGTIDMTPTWVSLLPLMLIAYTEGTPEGRKIAGEELKRMAQIADAYNELQKDK